MLALLRDLETVGFADAPRVVGDGYAPDGQMAVNSVPGESPHPRVWEDHRVGDVSVLFDGISYESRRPPADPVQRRAEVSRFRRAPAAAFED
ncbi:hypothetical protein GCM10011376_29710 [Nocardioides flavus (ex Wang et al. 2016)]|uniref:Uncharacterized protein n=1 Tax=Nocardioides flavus (ex Wang et al. 2016) TaxID=2058780 RepID=A0ABQ3HNP0_9ACTN|nr:hypothetical protein GCM10011376_29710 [Nocardioides flavus (ex Wang et al. 2016)]